MILALLPVSFPAGAWAKPKIIHVGNAAAASGATGSSLILEALRNCRDRRWSVAEQLVLRAHDRLAEKMFSWLYYTEGGSPVQFSRVAAFIRQNPDWPRQNRLLLTAERSLPENMPDAEVVAWFSEHTPVTASGMDHYLQALVRTNNQVTAGQIFRDWWKTAQLEPQQQTYFLQRGGSMLDLPTQELRLNYLLTTGQYVNARALAQVLGGGYIYLADAREAFASGRSNAFDYLNRVPPVLQRQPALLLDQLHYRLRQGDDFAAIEILHNLPPADTIANPADWWQERNLLIRHLIASHNYESAWLLARDHGLKEGPAYADAEFMAGWLALRFMHRPWDAFEDFEALYKNTATPTSRARGAYWAAQASEKLGYKDIARQWYQAAAQNQTTFYGQLAIGELKDQYRPSQQLPPQKTMEGKDRFDRMPLVRAAHFMDEAGMNEETGDILDTLAASAKTPEDYRLTAELAEGLGRPQNAVKIAKKGLNKGILLMDQLYPTILSHMRHVQIEWALAHALIRQESSFDFHAQSPVGAQGLMQVMPATARNVAERNHIPFHPELLGSDPDYNIEIGSLYFKQLIDKYDGSYPLALAAYNGGPGRVDGWLNQFGDPRRGPVDVADWIELIPVAETRNYVQRVLEGVYIYRLKLKGVQKSYNSQSFWGAPQ